MKRLAVLLIALAALALSGCQSCGFNGNFLRDTFTPDVSEEVYVR
ncbi:lipoprotein [Opitutia bacterium KCR 482]|nr:lipoprotein [Opitutae bacterium KCR 482]MDY5583260.1 lipoprotein [Candidatus Merdousia sp.]